MQSTIFRVRLDLVQVPDQLSKHFTEPKHVYAVRQSGAASSGLQPAPWMEKILLAAAIYNIAWETFAILSPLTLFRWCGFDPMPIYPELWQCIGMIVGVDGVGYAIAARDPFRHWPIVLVGLLGKIFGPIGFIGAVTSGRFPLAMGWTIVTNDLIWWIPFGLILWSALQSNRAMPEQRKSSFDTML